jgi:hypothetical protein
MKYDLVEIRPLDIGVGKQWDVRWSKDDTDRVDRKPYKPNGLGFFHYPRFMGLKKAFRLLKEEIIKEHKDEIERLQKSLDALEKLELPK